MSLPSFFLAPLEIRKMCAICAQITCLVRSLYEYRHHNHCNNYLGESADLKTPE